MKPTLTYGLSALGLAAVLMSGCGNSQKGPLKGFIVNPEAEEQTTSVPSWTEPPVRKPKPSFIPKSSEEFDALCLEVDKSERMLRAYPQEDCTKPTYPEQSLFSTKVIIGGLARDFHTDTYRQHPTPSGTYYISMMGGSIHDDPRWIHPKTKEAIAGPYGDYWFPLQRSSEPITRHAVSPHTYTMLGLHGTWDKYDVKFDTNRHRDIYSHGCVRLDDEEGLAQLLLDTSQNPSDVRKVYKRGPVRYLRTSYQVHIKE